MSAARKPELRVVPVRAEDAPEGRKMWAVQRGEEILGVYASEYIARNARDRMSRPVPRQRACITCGSTFRSEHAGHRMCKTCRPSAALPAQFYG